VQEIIRVVGNARNDDPPALGQPARATRRVPFSQLLPLVGGAAVLVVEHVIENEQVEPSTEYGPITDGSFDTTGRSTVMAVPVRLTNGNISGTPVSSYKVVAGCPSAQCPTGTLLTLNPAPAAGDVLLNGCESGTSLGANNCRLLGTKDRNFKPLIWSFVEGRGGRGVLGA